MVSMGEYFCSYFEVIPAFSSVMKSILYCISFLTDSEDEDKAKKVTVRFEKPETEKSRKAKEKSYGFLLRQIREEPWIEVNYHK